MEGLQRNERRQNTSTGECIGRDVFTTRFVLNVVSHVTQLKSPAENPGVFYFSSLALIEDERYSFLVSDEVKRLPFKQMTPATNRFDYSCGLFFNRRVAPFTSN